MSAKWRYVLDSNTFIDPKNRYYAFDICPGYWAALVALHEKNAVCSIDQVKDELIRFEDEISEWIQSTAPDSLFQPSTDPEVIEAFSRIITWVDNHQQYKPAAKSGFADGADGWLVAFSIVHGCCLVTHEERRDNARNKVPLPNVCIEFGVEYKNIFSVLRDEQVSFS